MLARYVFMVEYFNGKKLLETVCHKIMRISSDIVACVGLKLPLAYISENLLNALNPSSYIVLADLFIDMSQLDNYAIPHHIGGHWTLAGIECCTGCELSESADLDRADDGFSSPLERLSHKELVLIMLY